MRKKIAWPIISRKGLLTSAFITESSPSIYLHKCVIFSLWMKRKMRMQYARARTSDNHVVVRKKFIIYLQSSSIVITLAMCFIGIHPVLASRMRCDLESAFPPIGRAPVPTHVPRHLGTGIVTCTSNGRSNPAYTQYTPAALAITFWRRKKNFPFFTYPGIVLGLKIHVKFLIFSTSSFIK